MARNPRLLDKRLKAEVYDKIPKVACKKLCQEACSVVPCSIRETEAVEGAAGRTMGIRPVLTCSILNGDGSCGAYEARPTICRLFGAAYGLVCPHGCQPERWLTDGEAADLIAKADEIGGVDWAARRDLRALIEHFRAMRGIHG